MKHVSLVLGGCLTLAACTPTAGVLISKTTDLLGSAHEYVTEFDLTTASVAALDRTNLCKALGGTLVSPVITIRHSEVAGIPITARLYDTQSDGTVKELGTVTVRSEVDGETFVSDGFEPPCNTTAGKRNSTYKFDIKTKTSSITLLWGGYTSRDMHIILPADIQ